MLGRPMKSKLHKISNILQDVINYLVVIIFAIMIISCIMQVFTRYVLNSSVFWTEELARFTYIWCSLLGASICTKKRSHATVTVILNALPKSIKKVFMVTIQFLIMIAAVIMVVYGWQMVKMTYSQPSPALGLSMGIFYGSVPVAGALIFVQAFCGLFAEEVTPPDPEVST
jgi:TRAP-type C4-dicarboxylate transport system permease small subunit